MPVRSRADARTKPTTIDVDVTSPTAAKCKQELCDFDDMVRVCDSDSPIFSTVGSPDDVDSTGDELGDYELSYLHNLYQGDLQDAILPETDAPASLGMLSLSGASAPSSALKSIALSALGLKNPSSGIRAAVQPEISPHGHDSWEDEDDEDSDMTPSPRGASPVPTGPVSAKHSAKPVANNSSRKRKTGAVDGPLTPAPAKRAAKERACSPVDIDSPSSSRASSECPSSSRGDRLMLDGMEIRPEDDPLGLFSRDPATLTPEEQRLLKKQRRLLKNRESAQLSRHRKKCHLHTLEKQVDALKKEKAALQVRVQELLAENERLRRGASAASSASFIA